MNLTSYAIITGASSGIGEASSKALAKLGKNLILVARRIDRLEKLKKELEKKYKISVLPFQVDLQDVGQIDNFYKQIKAKKVDILVNNAGLAMDRKNLADYDWSAIETMINTNIKGFTKMAQGALPFIKKTKGHIVNISSIAGVEAYANGSIYCGTKAYVKMLSKALRMDLFGTDVRVTDIAPGAVQTEFALVRFRGDKNLSKKNYEGYVPLQAGDIADCIVFALTRPAHVNIDYLLVMPTAQVGVNLIAGK